MHYFVDVLLPLPLPKAFTYVVSEAEFSFLQPGHRVGVPFGKNKLYIGLVYKKHQLAPQTYTPKGIEVIFSEIKGANHFFKEKEEDLKKTIDKYIKDKTKLI